MLKKIIHVVGKIVFSRTLIIIIMMLAQAGFLFLGFALLGSQMNFLWGSFSTVSALVLVYLINKDEVPEFKISWLIPICLFPVFGALLFLYIDKNFGTIGLRKAMNKVISDAEEYMHSDPKITEKLHKENIPMYNLSQYIEKFGGYPTYEGGEAAYFPTGEAKWKDMLKELQKAEHFIFLEYFIVERGIMWDAILEVLQKKVAEGVEVRFMYDGMCSLMLLPYNYPKQMSRLGIQTKAFSPIVPILSTHQNNRDHRKILVIDGKTAYTGGVNLADEYINEKKKFGHWKDVAVKIKGKAVDSFTMMFLYAWDTKSETPSEYGKYLNKCTESAGQGYMMPYGDGPNKKENIAAKVYMDILNTAERYVHIMTPYFIVDSAMLHAIKYAAARGVEVKMLLPHIPDKKVAFAIARTYYQTLMQAGVKIYEYTPGFVHAKCFVSDDNEAVVGTINLDYRSLYHHFECAVYFYNNPIVYDMEKDFHQTLAESTEVTKEYYKKINPLWRVAGHIFNVFGPLM